MVIYINMRACLCKRCMWRAHSDEQEYDELVLYWWWKKRIAASGYGDDLDSGVTSVNRMRCKAC